MQIISGKFKRLKLHFPKDQSFRPTKGIVRESIFNKIGNRIQGTIFLDLCSGTGSVGFEAESRGASHVICVDQNVDYICQNALRLQSNAEIVQSSVQNYLKQYPKHPVDYIYFDPVWSVFDMYKDVFEQIVQHECMAPSTWLCVEHESHEKLPMVSGLIAWDSCQFGRSMVTILRQKKDGNKYM